MDCCKLWIVVDLNNGLLKLKKGWLVTVDFYFVFLQYTFWLIWLTCVNLNFGKNYVMY